MEKSTRAGVFHLSPRCHYGPLHHWSLRSVVLVLPPLPRTAWSGQGVCKREGNQFPLGGNLSRTEDGGEGTGVTGGNLPVLPRVIQYCRELKEEFGPSYHIHLYTGSAPCEEELQAVQGYVDEIRMHPPPEEWSRFAEGTYGRAAIAARQMGFSVGVEVPSLPGVSALAGAMPLLDFLNINETRVGGDQCARDEEEGTRFYRRYAQCSKRRC